VKLGELLTVGHGIQISWQGRTYPSMLLDHDDRHMYVSVIGDAGRWVHLSPGTQLEVAFGVPNRGYFRFQASVVAEVNLPAPAIKLPYPDNMDHVQQRRFFRLSVQIPVNYRVITDLRSHQAMITYPAHTIDLSAGGLQLLTNEGARVDDLLEIDLLLGASGVVSLLAEVRRTVRQFDGTYQVAVEYTELDRRQEDLIIRWVFQEQARRRRLGLH